MYYYLIAHLLPIKRKYVKLVARNTGCGVQLIKNLLGARVARIY
jgi:hypothetical protein